MWLSVTAALAAPVQRSSTSIIGGLELMDCLESGRSRMSNGTPSPNGFPSGLPDAEPRAIDSDVDLTVPAQRRELGRGHGAVLLVIAMGGAIGSLLRYQAGLIWPTPAAAFPTTTLVVNVLGCLVIGVFMVVITEVWTAHRLVRPFVGTGLLGGFTTFSTYSLDVATLLRAGEARSALLYLALTAVAAVAAVAIGMLTTRRLVVARRHG